jgi:hypothetical protein
MDYTKYIRGLFEKAQFNSSALDGSNNKYSIIVPVFNG